MSAKVVVAGFPESRDFARSVAKKAGVKYTYIEIKEFPDKETYLRFNVDIQGKTIYLILSLDDPDKKIMQIVLTAYTAKELKAKKVILVAPYLCYMRQDKRFKPGEAVSSRIIARIFNACLDGLITVDPHLHRYKSLDEIFKMESKTLTAVDDIARFIKKNVKNPFIFGPDQESYQWAQKVAKIVGCEYDVLKKKRYSSETVRIKIKEKYDFSRKSVVLVDDVVSTGHTMIEVIKDVKKLGAKKIYCACTHGIFAEDALLKMQKLGAVVFSTNTIKNKVNKIDVTGLIAKEII